MFATKIGLPTETSVHVTPRSHPLTELPQSLQRLSEEEDSWGQGHDHLVGDGPPIGQAAPPIDHTAGEVAASSAMPHIQTGWLADGDSTSESISTILQVGPTSIRKVDAVAQPKRRPAFSFPKRWASDDNEERSL